MPLLNNEVLDDPLLYDGESSFSGGMVSLVKPSLLGEGSCSELVNIDIDRSGRLMTRLGTDALGTAPNASHVRGLFYYDWTSDFLMRVSNGALQSWDSAAWATVSGFTPNAAFNVEMCQLQGNLYLTNGTTIYSWAGSGAAAALVDIHTPACRYLVSHAGRVFAAGLTAKDNITWSTLLDGTAWDPADTFSVGGGDGEGITGMCSWQSSRLLVFKRNSIYAVNTPSTVTPGTDTWSTETVNRRIGCVAHRSIQQVGNDVFFLSEDGVRTLGRTLSDQEIGVSSPISEPIDDIIKRINWAYIDTASSVYHANRYLLSVPVDSATTPNYVLVWNQLTKSWSGYWTGWNATAFAKTEFSGTSKVVFGNATGGTHEWLGWQSEVESAAADYNDSGVVYASSVTTRGFHFRDYLSPKVGYSYELEFYKSSSDVSAYFIVDRGGSKAAYSGPTQRGVLYLPLDLPFLLPAKGSFRTASDLGKFGRFFSIQVKLSVPSGKLAVQGFGLTAFLDTIRNEA